MSEGNKPSIEEILEAAAVGEVPIAREEEAQLYNFISSLASALHISVPDSIELDWYQVESRDWLLDKAKAVGDKAWRYDDLNK